MFFADHFDGTEIDSSTWTVSVNGYPAPGVVVSGGFAQFGQPGENSLDFPYVESAVTTFPSTGSFSVEVAMRYNSIGGKGSGLAILGPNNEEILRIWADANSGLRAKLRGSDFSSVGDPTGLHQYRLMVTDNDLLVFVDGALVLSSVADARPASIWIGHPTIGQVLSLEVADTHPVDPITGVVLSRWWSVGAWTTFELDFVVTLNPQAVLTSKQLAAIEAIRNIFIGEAVVYTAGALCAALTVTTGGIGCVIIGAAGALTAAIEGVQALVIIADPPDPNYQVVFTPNDYTPYVFGPDPGLAQEVLDQANATLAAQTDLYEIFEAWRVSLERYMGAIEAGDSAAASVQLAALETYIASSEGLAAAVEVELALLMAQLEAITGPVPFPQSDVIAAQADLAANGFSSEQYAVFQTVSISQAVADELIDDIATADPSLVPGEAYLALDNVAKSYGDIATVVPEPGATLQLVIGILGLAALGRRRYRR